MTLKRLLVTISLITLFWTGLSAFFFLNAPSLKATTEEVLLIRIRNELSDRAESYIRDVVSVANYRRSRLVIVSLDTPGGYVSNVERMLSIIDESEIPVVVFVEPLRAVSGGTYILMAAHVAAMKPGSVIGSCQPVSVTGELITESKYVNYLAGLMRSHAWLHSRNETAAQLFVTENLNLNAEQAIRFNVIDLIADNVEDLLSKLNNQILLKYKDGEALRFILARKEEIGKYEASRSWDFENINKASIKEFKGAIEFLYLPSFFFEFPIVLSFPIALLLPYAYPVIIVPILSLTVSVSPEILIALFSGVNGVIGVCCIFLILSRKSQSCPRSSGRERNLTKPQICLQDA